MAKIDTWMPVYIGDYLADTGELTTEEHGAYLLLMFHYWRKGPLPSDERRLASISGLSGDAWSIAWAMLKDFFVVADDGLLHHKRIDHELKEATEKRQKSTERAEKAARARWGDAPSIAQASPQALHEECPSPSPSPKKRTSGKPDPRHTPFRESIAKSFEAHSNGIECTWDSSEAGTLSKFLQANPKLSIGDLTRLLRNRELSGGVVFTERPRAWISTLTRYAAGPVETWKLKHDAPAPDKAPLRGVTLEEARQR